MRSNENDEVEEPKSRIMRMIDYRTHPFSIPLILYILIVVSFLLSKQFEFTLSLQTGGNPRYVIRLPASMYLEAALVFLCGFIYIIHNGDFFGIHKEKQSGNKLVAIHFIVLISLDLLYLSGYCIYSMLYSQDSVRYPLALLRIHYKVYFTFLPPLSGLISKKGNRSKTSRLASSHRSS